MICSRLSLLKPLHSAISGKVRRQPRQRPEAPSTTQTWIQGVAMAFRGGILKTA